jgi:DNA repair protein RecO (recombination protein O)
MPVYRDEAVIIRTHKLGEADRIVTMLSRYHGLIRAVAKGVRRTTSKFGSRLEPFMVVDIQLHEGRNLDTVNQVETLNAYGGQIIEDYPAYTSATVMVETAEKLAGGETSPQQYLLLVGGLRALANKDHDSGLILDSYLLRALSVAGWAPNFSDCARCGKPGLHQDFVLQAGGMVCSASLAQ